MYIEGAALLIGNAMMKGTERFEVAHPFVS